VSILLVAASILIPANATMALPQRTAPDGVRAFAGRSASALGVGPSPPFSSLPAVAPADTVPNGSLGSVAYSWVLSNDTVLSGAVNQRYPLTPDQLLYLPATEELWAAFASPPPGEPFNTTVVNLSNGATDILNGVGNVTGFAYDPTVQDVFLTQIPSGGRSGQLLQFGVRSHELARVPTAVQPHPSAVAYASGTGDLWVAGWSNATSTGSVEVVSDSSGLVRAVVPVGREPSVVVFDATAALAFVANSGSSNLTVLHEADATAAGTVALPGSVVPGAFAFDGVTGDLVALAQVGAATSSSLVTVDPSNDSVADLGPLMGNLTASTLSVDPATGDVYVATEPANGSSASGGELLRWTFGGSTWSVVGDAGRDPNTQAFDPAGQLDFVGHTGQSYVSVLNVSGASASPRIVEFGGGPRGGTFDATDGRVYVVNAYEGGSSGSAPDVLDAVDPASGSAAVAVSPAPPGTPTLGSDPAGVVDDPSSATLWVADRGWSAASVLSAGSGAYLGSVALPFAPVAVADDATRGVVYFASDDGRVVAVNATDRSPADVWNVTVPTVPWNATFEAIAVDASTGDVIGITPDLGPTGSSDAWILDPQNGSSRLLPLGAAGAGAGGNYPTAVAFDPLDGEAYVASSSGTVYVVDPTNASVVTSGSVGTRLSYLAFDAGPKVVVAADGGAGELRLLNGTSPDGLTVGIVTVPVGPDPEGVAVDPTLDQVVVSDYGSATLDVFSTVPEVGSLTVHITIPTVGQLPGVTSADDVGRPVLFVALAGGGNGPLTFGYADLPTGCLSSNTSELFCQPTGAGAFEPTVTATDAAGVRAEAGTLLTVEPAPTLSASAIPDPVDEDRANVTIAVVVTGGLAPFQYAVGFGDGSPAVNGTTTGDGFVVEHPYHGPGTYAATISVIDEFSATASTTVPVVLAEPMTGSASVVSLFGSTKPLTLTFEAQVTGGVAPYTFTWEFPGGTQSASSATNRSTVTETFDAAGPVSVGVWANDSARGSLLLFVNTTVPVPPATHAPASLLPWLALAIGGGIVAAAAVVVLLRRRTPPPAAGTPPE
jgi:DNA-binding beta-propeller fold protein YncE